LSSSLGSSAGVVREQEECREEEGAWPCREQDCGVEEQSWSSGAAGSGADELRAGTEGGRGGDGVTDGHRVK
jgi:hypothetical protein